ncbi:MULTISPECIES: signal peptide peptidase SppA [unclassified Staphylococcus]|uniref:signal peptide peptidase SppA n=1 Tax=unclassified Staphylococcus TaxID=91994 RepID=UPI0021D36C92|nr:MULTISPECIES: signal peptide peptidase SppA [unclassified Staphylococcus]UXR79141.1 signal peptide peptidase SppA [Staphylococcus sp. IVB6227]UXR81762.1 signal peptide peptidase SppA [Staphylococcus sp. IVB6214]
MSKRIVAIIIAAVIVLSGILTSAVTTLASSVFNSNLSMIDEAKSTVVEEGNGNKQIAKLSVKGEIVDMQSGGLFASGGYDHQMALKQLDAIKEDDTIKGVFLTVDSPGGSTYASDEFYQKLKEVKDSGKKVYVQMETMAASGGYYISAPADKIYAGPQSLTGSIGVISQAMDYSELLNNLGVKTNTIKSGEHKDIMSPSKEMTQEERDILQSINKDSYDQFIDVIVKGRHMSESKVRELADGRIYSAQQAKRNGLIDEIGYKEASLKDLKKAIKAEDAQVISYDQADMGFGSLFGAKSFFKGIRADIEQVKSILNNETQTRPMYKYEG